MAYNAYHFAESQIPGSKKWLPPGDRYMNHVKEGVGGGGGVNVFSVCAEETGQVKNCLGECSYSPRWRVLQNFSFQPWYILVILQ